MTAIAPAPAHAPVAPHLAHPAHGALSQAHDSLAFAAVLDAVPGGDAKPKPSSGEAQTPAESPRRDHPQAQQIANPSFFNAPLASSPTVATSTTIGNGKDDDVRTPELAAGATAPTPASDAAPPTRVANAAQGGSSIVARLVGERSFHASVAASSPATVAPVGGLSSVTDAPALATEVLDALAAPVSPASITTSNPSRPVASPPPVSPPTPSEPSPSRADRTLATASAPVQFSAGRARGERQTDVASITSRSAVPAAETSAPGPGARRTSDESKSDSGGSVGPSSNGGPNPASALPASAPAAAQQSLTAAFAVPQSRVADAAAGPSAPRAARPPAASPALSAAPVREIDVDLSPGGLEDVSMTMRLAGDRLSLVFRAGSSQTTGAIEGARDAIAERLAAIGQPLGSLIIQQTGSTTDATNARNTSSGGSGGEGRPQARGGDPNDPRGARRGSSGF